MVSRETACSLPRISLATFVQIDEARREELVVRACGVWVAIVPDEDELARRRITERCFAADLDLDGGIRPWAPDPRLPFRLLSWPGNLITPQFCFPSSCQSQHTFWLRAEAESAQAQLVDMRHSVHTLPVITCS